MKDIIVPVCVMLYNAFIAGGTAYLVFYKGISPWWFLFTILLMASYKTT